MMQRIGLAQAMVTEPELLLLDEPTDGVDPVGKVEIRQVLEKAKAAGTTIFLNSHLLSEVEYVADRVAILNKGKVVRVDTVGNLTHRQSQYEIEAAVGHHVLEIPEDTARVISVATGSLMVEVADEEHLNGVIDYLRMRKILIRSVKPVSMTLEQSFFEIVSGQEGQQP
jgi:ABC-2 type transport system ATP-binding protein